MKKLYPYPFEFRKEHSFYPSKPPRIEADTLEIGPGNGSLLTLLAKGFPQRQFLAIERVSRRYQRLCARIDRLQLDNTLLIHGDARAVIPRYVPEETFQRIYILFPDPWPKRRQGFRRLLAMDFLVCLARSLKNQGELFIATDVKDYADQIQEDLKGIPLLERAEELELDISHRTFFEEKWQRQGKSIHRLFYRKLLP